MSFFTLQVAYWQWTDSVSEQLQVAGSFADNKQKLLILKDLLMFEQNESGR